MRKRWKISFGILTFILLLSLSLTLLIWTGWAGERLRLFAIGKLEELTHLNFEIDSLKGNLITNLVAKGIRITQPEEAEPLLQLEEITFRYNILDLMLGSKDVKYITITSPSVNLKADWNFRKEESPTNGGVKIPDFSIRSLKVRKGKVVGIPKFGSIDSIDLHLSVSSRENLLDFTIIRCSLTTGDLRVRTIVSQGLFDKGLLKLRRFHLATQGSRIDLKGVLGNQTIHLDGELNLELDDLSKLLSQPFLSGTFHSSFRIRRAKGSGNASGTIIVHRGEVKQWFLGDFEGEFNSDFKKVLVDLDRWSIGNGEAKGTVEWDLKTSAVIANITGTGLDLSQLSVPLRDYSSLINFETSVNFSSTFPELTGRVNIRMDKSRIRGVYADELVARVNIKPKVLEIEDLKLISGTSLTLVSGRIFPSAMDLRVETEGIELSQLSDILNVKTLSGQLFADLLIQGDPKKPFIIGSFWTKELSLPNTEIGYMSGNLSFQYQKGNPTIDLSVAITQGTIFDRKLSNFSLNVNGEGDSFYYSTAFGVETSSVRLTGEIRTSNGQTKVVNQYLDISSNGQSITTDGDLVLVLSPKTELKRTKFSLCDGWVELAGGYSSPDSIQLILSAEKINLEDLAQLAGMRQVLRGYLDINFESTGSFSHPEFDLEAKIDDFSYEYANLDQIELKISYENDKLDLTELTFQGKRGAYSIKGYLPVDLSPKKLTLIDKEMELSLDLHGLEPWMFQSIASYLELKKCELDGNLYIHGTPIEPKISGVIKLQDGEFYSRFLKTFITRLNAELKFQDDQIRIASLSGKTEDGTLKAKGTIKLERLIPETLDLKVDLVKLPVRGIKDVYALIEADLRVHGDLKEPSIDGKIGIDELLITTPFQQKAGPGLERKPLNFQCDLLVDANRSIWIRNRNANIQLDGELNVKVKEGLLILSGELNTVRGWVRYYDREFEIVKGRFKFTDIPEINPELDILAETEVIYTSTDNGIRSSKRDVIRLQITGFMRTPEVTLSSESGELSELDIFSLLTLNMTWSELSSEARMDILREQAAGRVLDLAASQLTQEIRQAVGLDALRVRVKPIGEETGAKLTVGKYISRDLYVSYTSELFSTEKDQFRVEYFVGRRGSVVAERNEKGRYFIGFNYKFRF